MRPNVSCYGLTSKESTGLNHVNDKQVNDMMGQFKNARLDLVGKVPQEKHEGIKGAKTTVEPR